MEFEYIEAEKPSKWPVNAREKELENILNAVKKYEEEKDVLSREYLISLVSNYDLNQTGALGECRITAYEVAAINHLYIWSTRTHFHSLKCYLYDLIGHTTRMHKMEAYVMQSLGETESVNIQAYEEGLYTSLNIYYMAYLLYTVNNTMPFSDAIIKVVNDNIQSVLDEKDEYTERKLFYIAQAYISMLNDISFFHGNKTEKMWQFTRDELKKLFEYEFELISLTKQDPKKRPLKSVLITQISNYILKSRHGYNNDYICKYLSVETAKQSFNNSQIWMNPIRKLNDQREGHIVEELFKNREWVQYDWIADLCFEPCRNYYVSSFSKSVNDNDMQKEYGEVCFGYKSDKVGELISPQYVETFTTEQGGIIEETCIGQVTAFDVIYDIEELKEELVYLFSIIDKLPLHGERKNALLNDMLQYWLYSIKDSKWAYERERRYVLFLYDSINYQHMIIENDFLKLDTSLFLYPDFVVGKHPKHSEIAEMIKEKTKTISYKNYVLCNDCLDRDYDLDIYCQKNIKCPVCGSNNLDVYTPESCFEQ